MSRSEKIFVDNVAVRLDNITYSFIAQPETAELSVLASDKAEIVEGNMNHLVIRLTRIIEFMPVDFYKTNISVLITYYLNSRTADSFSSNDDLLKYANNHIKVLINKTPVCSSISTVISQITSTFGQVPIVTSAQFIEKEK